VASQIPTHGDIVFHAKLLNFCRGHTLGLPTGSPAQLLGHFQILGAQRTFSRHGGQSSSGQTEALVGRSSIQPRCLGRILRHAEVSLVKSSEGILRFFAVLSNSQLKPMHSLAEVLFYALAVTVQ
jgi:hypothetical protein